MSSTDAYLDLCAAVADLARVDLTMYKRPQMERRLNTFAKAQGVGDVAGLARAVLAGSIEPRLLVSYLTIHVSEFFRDPRFFNELRRVIRDVARVPGTLRAWSAGCSIGAEPYSLAMTLLEERPDQPFRILATDLDEESLARARLGRYRQGEVGNVDRALRELYFAELGEEVQVTNRIRALVRFARHDLLKDAYPGNLDLILFRNVAIYFADGARLDVLARLRGALRPGGILMIGATETILRPESLGLHQVRPFFFVRD